jgi:hypothetical protein
MSNTSRKARSYEELLNAIKSVNKFASEARKVATDTNTPEDPNKEPIPAQNKEQIATPEDRDLPTPQPTNEGEAKPAGANTDLEQLEANETTIDPKKGENVEEEKKVNPEAVATDVSIKAASLLNKIKSATSKKSQVKEANHVNVASDISLDTSTLSKVASIMLSTEEGQRQVAHAVAKARANGIKLASLNELININQMYKAQEEMQRKYASYDNVLKYHATEMNKLYKNDQACKYAYAQGAQDANAMMAAQGGAAVPPEAMAPAPESNQNEAQQIVNSLVQAGMVDPNMAQQLVALAGQVSGGQPMTPETLMAWIEQAVQQGLLAPEAAQEIVAQLGGGQPEQAPAAPEAAPAQVPGPEVQAKVAHIVDAAQKILHATAILKTAAAKEGVVDSPEVTPEDIDVVTDAAVANGEISPEEAEAATDLIAAGATEAAGEDDGIDALAEELAAAGVTEEEVDQALKELASEEGAPVEDEDASVDAVIQELIDAGVSEEEIAQAIEELAVEGTEGDEEISDEEALALAKELEAAGIDEDTLAAAIEEAAPKCSESECEKPSEEPEEISEEDFEEKSDD